MFKLKNGGLFCARFEKKKGAFIFFGKFLIKGYAKMKKVKCEKRFLIFIHS